MPFRELEKPIQPHHIHNQKNKGWKALVSGIFISSLITLSFAQLLFTANIPITVILPTSAPIWIGIATMIFLTLKD